MNDYKLQQLNPSSRAIDWFTVNPVLFKGEIGFESDTLLFKIGDGARPWNELPYSQTTNALQAGDGIVINSQHEISATLLYNEVS